MKNATGGVKGFQKVDLHERFWLKVDRRNDDECWPW